MLPAVGTEYWYVVLPSGKPLRGENAQATINREMNELVGRGWKPESIASGHPAMQIGVMFKKETP